MTVPAKTYLRAAACISPLAPPDAEGRWSADAPAPVNAERLHAVEPDYSRFVDAKTIRRMSRIVKMGVAAAMGCLDAAGRPMPEAIVTGTAYGCLGDTGVFLKRMIENGEEMLSPTAFIQSTHNTVGAQVALMLKCHAYNNTIVHRAFSFEQVLTESRLLLAEGMGPVLAGAIDELTEDSFRLLRRFGVYRHQPGRPVAPAGEGAAFFVLSAAASPDNLAELGPVATRRFPAAGSAGTNGQIAPWVIETLEAEGIAPEQIRTVLDGSAEGFFLSQRFAQATVIPFKKYCGEYPTAMGFAVWLAALKCRGLPMPWATGPVSNEAGPALAFNRSVDGHCSLIVLSPC